MVKDLESEFDIEALQVLMEVIFSPDLMEVYLRVLNPIASEGVRSFHISMAKEIMEWGGKFWLILRTCFN